MTREMMPLRDAIGRFAGMHEGQQDRVEAWAEEVAPKIAAKLGVPLHQLRPVLHAYLAHHLATLSEVIHMEAAELTGLTGPCPNSSCDKI